MKIAKRAQVPPFAVMELIAAANARRASGQDVISLAAGEPSGGAGEAIRARASQALADGDGLGYTEALGMPVLRQAVADLYRQRHGVEVSPDRVAITTGSSGGFALAFLTAFDAGDRVAVVRPGYPAYRNILTALGCRPVELACGPQTGFRPNVAMLAEVHEAEPLSGLVVASPANPTGTMIDRSALAELAMWCQQRGVRLISDELYHGISYTGAAASAAEHLDRGAVVVNSFSKFWAMTGWRLGWLVLPADLAAPLDALAGNLALCPPSLAQHAALAALGEDGMAAATSAVADYAASRDLLLRRLPELGWAGVAPPDGAFYLYADISDSGLDSVTWCERLLAEAGVALTPGTDFDPVDGGRWVRLSFAAPPDVVAEGLDRIVAWQAGRSAD